MAAAEILVTRPRADAEVLAAELAGRGYTPILAPLLKILPCPQVVPDLEGVQALVFTSANGLRVFAKTSRERRLPVYTVGPGTRMAAEAAGFRQVAAAEGEVKSLAAKLLQELSPQDGRILHLSGAAVAGDLVGELGAAGFRAERTVLYDARAAERLPEAAADALAGRTLDATVFFSPRTAKTFVRLVQEAGLVEACTSVRAYCLSDAVAGALTPLVFAEVRVAARPDGQALLDLLPPTSVQAASPASPPRRARIAITEPGTAMQEDEPRDSRSRHDQKPQEKPQEKVEDKVQDKTSPSGAAETEKAATASTAQETGGSRTAGGEASAETSDAAKVIAAFGGIRPMAHKLGLAVSTVQGWKVRDAIPATRHDEILAAARTHDVDLDQAVLRASDTPGASDTLSAGAPKTAAEAQPDADAAGSGRAIRGAGEAGDKEEIEDAEVTEIEEQETEEQPTEATGLGGAAGSPGEPTADDRKPGFLAGMLLGAALLAIGIGAAIATRPIWAPSPESADGGPSSGQLQALESRIDDLGADVAALAGDAAETVPAAEMEEQISALANRIGEIDSDLNDRLASLEQNADSGVSEAVARLTQRLDEVEDSIAAGPASEDIARIARQAAGQQAAIALAYSQLRDALLAGRPYESELSSMRRAAGSDPDVAAELDLLVGDAAEGVVAMDRLREDFDQAARAAVAASAGDGVEGWLAGVYRQVARLVTVRPTGDDPDDQSTAGLLARAEVRLAQDDLEGALELLNGLSAQSREAMSGWLAEAEARRDALAALRGLAGAVFSQLEVEDPAGNGGTAAGSTGEDG